MKKQIYGWGMELLLHLFFIICHPYIIPIYLGLQKHSQDEHQFTDLNREISPMSSECALNRDDAHARKYSTRKARLSLQ